MARGADAKIDVAKRIAAAFGPDWVGEVDKKYYVWGHENGEKVQICISMTCPKVPVGGASAFVEDDSDADSGDLNFESMPPKPVVYEKAEISAEEQQTVQDLMRRLGL